ncbi:hypothetical protein U9M48_000627 [Paspalum notatum var. saurae]|uniref:NB-ARC domain-containing protein n=1 Tax=Paspalum notatum var. saurae TaxID=547442 RepID=A0AAQ3SCG8_PASNO
MTSVVRLVSSMIVEVCGVMEKDMERHEKLFCGLKSIKNEMELVKGLIKEKECPGALQEIRIRHLQELAYDVEDFLESLWQPGVYGRKVLAAVGMDPRPPQLVRIEYFEKTLKSLKQEWEKISESGTESTYKAVDAMSDPNWYAAAEELEAMDVHKAKIRELLSPSPGEEERLRVVSIVGCRGVGKTALAGAVYQDCLADTNAFDCVAWVVASGCSDKNSLLDKIFQAVQAALASRRAEADGDYSGTALQDILSKKRCLVFIDDVWQAQVWKDTVDACLLNDSKSRIIMTTSVRSVAKACSSGRYVYNMQCLSNDESRRLFWRKVYGNKEEEPSYALEMASEKIFTKCGGLPLALISVAKHLNLKGDDLDSDHFEDVGQNLGKDYLSGINNDAVSAFQGIKRALTQCYNNLPDYDHRLFFLYLSVFPRGHHIKSKSLVRRLMAEGLVVNEGSCKCFDQLVDHCIVKPVQVSNNLVVAKSYQVHDVVLEYIIEKSQDKNLVITLAEGREPLDVGSNGHSVRRLCVQSGMEISFDEHKDTLRSLTMFEAEPSELQSCKLLRLLDLEGCTDLDQSFLDGLSRLLLLRYLSLRNTAISRLPTHMEYLQRLEMLDIRETRVEKLPITVIMLPKLAHLYGKFRLESTSSAKEITMLSVSDFMKKKSVLHTVSGYVANETQGPEHVILLAKNLKKVKVWCNQTRANNTIMHHGSRSMGMRCRRTREGTTQCDNFDFIGLLKSRVTPLDSVSIVSSRLCNNFMDSLGGRPRPYAIGSIKLRGNLDCLPDYNKLINLGRIKKIQLFSTGLSINDLSALQYLRCLEYLKLVEYSDTFYSDILVVEENRFESLKNLYIEAVNVPRMQFRQGAMKSLTSLHLLCPNISPMQPPSETIVGILHLANLCEVILHSSMQPEWDNVADGHPKRPRVKRQPKETANTAA